MKKWEKRKKTSTSASIAESKSSPLPTDYLRLVESTLTQALDKGLSELKKLHPISEFHADGALFEDEVLLTITLSHGPATVAATTVYGSADYNPAAEKPGLEATLGLCVDAVGGVFEFYLDPEFPEHIAQIANQSLGALEQGPFDWTKQNQVWVKIDKTNPHLEKATEDWLMKNDPDYQSRLDREKSEESGHAEEFLNDRLEAIKKAKSGSSGGPGSDSGPIRH